VSEFAGIALPFAPLARPAGGTGAASVLRIAGGVIVAVAHLGAVLSEVVQITRPVALDVFHPAVHKHWPVSGSHLAPFWQSQRRAQS